MANALKLLQSHHREVEDLFEQIEKLSDGAASTRRNLLDKLADRIAAHSEIEERIFYPGVKTPATEELLREALEEHLGAKRLLADLMELDDDDEQLMAKVAVLKEQIEHHVEEEEKELFPEVRKACNAERLERLGAEMESLYEELMQGEPRKEVPRQTDQAPPLG